MANKVEQVFRASLNTIKDRTYFLKLQVYPGAKTCMPADYIILGKHKRYLVECKQVDLRKNEKRPFAFDRLTQEEALFDFERRHEDNVSFLLIGFVRKRTKDSDYFLIPMKNYLQIRGVIGKKSALTSDFKRLQLSLYNIEVGKGSILDLENFFH